MCVTLKKVQMIFLFFYELFQTPKPFQQLELEKQLLGRLTCHVVAV